MGNDHEKLESEVLEEFELDGKPAKIIRLRAGDINDMDLAEHAKNLADTNFKLIDSVPNAKGRAALRSVMFQARQKLAQLPVFGSSLNSPKVEGLLDKVYPDYTLQEHFEADRNRNFPELIEKGQVLAVEMDGRIVAVQAHKNFGMTSSGRPVYTFTKASTLNSSEYRGKRLNPKLKKTIFDIVMNENPDAIWIAASINQDHVKKFERRGWHIAELDDPHDAVKLMHDSAPKYYDIMKEQGYKAVYMDPKVDKISWE